MTSPMRRLSAIIISLVIFIVTVIGFGLINDSFAASKKVKKITVKATAAQVDIGGHVKVYVKKVKPAKASKAVKFKSSNSKVATVNKKGIVTGKKKGTVTITVTSKKNKKVRFKVKIYVKDLSATSFILSEKELKMPSQTDHQLTCEVKGSIGYNNQGVVWSSSDPSVASVDGSGKVSGISGGNAIITVAEKNGSKSESCSVTVLDKMEVGETGITFGEFKWSVLDTEDNKALLITDRTVENHSFNNKYAPVTWATCDLRTYLNSDFINDHFTAEEQSMIAVTENTNPDNEWFGTAGGDITEDKVFLLSLEEVVKYFGDSGLLSAGRPKDPDNNQIIDDEFNNNRIARNESNTDVWWWLRSPGFSPNTAGIISRYGYLYVMGYFVDKSYAIRPAIWINLK